MGSEKKHSASALIKAAKKMIVTQKDVEEMKARLNEYEKRIDLEQKNSRVNNEFLNKTYSI